MHLPLSLALISFNFVQPFDKWLIIKINQDWGNSFFDQVLPFFRETGFWYPLYLFVFSYVILRFGKKGWLWIIGLLLTAALSDIASSQIIKQLIIRVRPCQDPEVGVLLRFFINYCPGSSSFTSSHATTHFGQAMFYFLTLRQTGRSSLVAFGWAFAIAYTQVYVGVHYPFDVFCGALLGCGIGWLVAKAYNKQVGMLSLDK